MLHYFISNNLFEILWTNFCLLFNWFLNEIYNFTWNYLDFKISH